MNPEDHGYSEWPTKASLESSCETWVRLCTTWTSILRGATLRENASDVAHAELTLAMCERERARVEALFHRVPAPRALAASLA